MNKNDFQSRPHGVDLAAGLKTAMRRMPASVALITTYDPAEDRPAGLAATTVIPVSMEPPSMLVAVNRAASAHSALKRAGRYCVNLLDSRQAAIVASFSSSEMREKRFESHEWSFADKLPYLPHACANIFCEIRDSVAFGTHELFIGEVFDVLTNGSEEARPLGWFDGTFAQLEPLARAAGAA